jgi:hypothetical protein
MKFRLLFFSFLVSVSVSLFAQRAADGEKYFNSKQYTKARAVYEALLKQRPNDALYNYRFARCSYELKDYPTAIKHFEMSGSRYPLRDLYLGELYFNSYQFDKSVMAYQTYIATLKPSDTKLSEYESKVKMAENAARLFNRVEDIAIVDSVVVNKTEFLRYYKTGNELGTFTQELLKLNSNKIVDKIKHSTQRQDREFHSDTIKGQLDIFTSYKLLDDWSKPVSVSKAINTSANENYPFLSLDGITLYFASDGEKSIGGYDILITRYNSSTNSYLPPENIGMPFNSPANDYMMVIDELHKLGWFATDRNQPVGKVMIYTFIPNEIKKIIRSEDKEYVARVAQLKKYRKSTKKLADDTTIIYEQMEDIENQIQFIVNDSIIYTQGSQFKSEVAGNLWLNYKKTNAELINSKALLEGLREQYNNDTEQNKEAIINNILDLEKKINTMKNEQLRLTIQLRNEENKFLKEPK